CLGMRACHTNNCPVGIATMKENLRARLEIQKSAKQLHNYFEATQELMAVLARACGHSHISEFDLDDLSTFDYDMHRLAGVPYAGVNPI
ncbi:MAG: glutamate synthase-related protein, partial [Bacteroidota bacterium]